MKTQIKLSIKTLLILAICSTNGSWAQSPFVVTQTKIDEVRTPKNGFDAARDCSDSSLCSALLSAASEYFQVPIDSVVSGMALFSSRQSGEGTTMTIYLPDGYRYCRSEVKMVSIVPNEGSRGSTLMVRAMRRGIAVETWTPILGLGEGRSWVEADITVFGVHESISDLSVVNRCHPATGRSILTCRGKGCVDTIDEGQIVSQESPSANNRNPKTGNVWDF